MKIYTRKGDEGNTSLIGGSKVPKDHIRIEAYGTLDELNSWMGLLRDSIDNQDIKAHIIRIQNDLFTIGSHLAAEEGSKMKLPELNKKHIELLESSMDTMDSELPPMKNFVLPGGHSVVSNCHIARCVCRRAERRVVSMATHNILVPNDVIQYLNRLSDWLFMLSRKCSKDLNSEEIPWIPNPTN
jgi:cob(I)alamin adenosyltransferase